MAEETPKSISEKRVKELEEKEKELAEIRQAQNQQPPSQPPENQPPIVPDGTQDPAKPEKMFCGDCKENGAETEVTEGQDTCSKCGAELEWPES